MRKIFLYSTAAFLALSSCREEESVMEIKEPETLELQNSYDDQAIQKYMAAHYLDTLGNIKPFSDTDPADDNYLSLLQLNPVTLPSGVIYIMRDGAQPNPGTPIGETDIIRLMTNATTQVAADVDGEVKFTSTFTFKNTISGSGNPDVDPLYYYAPQSVLDAGTTDASKQRSFYEIEGFREALQYFEAYDIPDSENYTLQGVIIVPSRAAFARDAHANYTGYSMRNRTLVFNFQVYKTTPRP